MRSRTIWFTFGTMFSERVRVVRAHHGHSCCCYCCCCCCGGGCSGCRSALTVNIKRKFHNEWTRARACNVMVLLGAKRTCACTRNVHAGTVIHSHSSGSSSRAAADWCNGFCRFYVWIRVCVYVCVWARFPDFGLGLQSLWSVPFYLSLSLPFRSRPPRSRLSSFQICSRARALCAFRLRVAHMRVFAVRARNSIGNRDSDT